MSKRRTLSPLVALVVLVVLLAIGYGVNALRGHGTTTHPQVSSSSPAVALSSLPPQAAQTVALIEKGGPFPYSQDGVVFDNNEHLLPSESRGFYHEYTVTTPGASDRATRRIVTGQDGSYYYTDDHYESFERVDVRR